MKQNVIVVLLNSSSAFLGVKEEKMVNEMKEKIKYKLQVFGVKDFDEKLNLLFLELEKKFKK
jgi:hypothetical protein